MNYKEFKEIMAYLKRTVKCNKCKKKAMDEKIYIIGYLFNELALHVQCPECGNNIVIKVTLHDDTETEKNMTISQHDAPPVSHNDVIDVHNFLNNFNGDFKKIFSSNK